MKNFNKIFFIVLECNEPNVGFEILLDAAKYASQKHIPCIIKVPLCNNTFNVADIEELKKTDSMIMVEIRNVEDYDKMSSFVDIFHIPQFLARQTDYIVEGGKRNIPINLAKGYFMSPSQIKLAYEKYAKYGNNQFFITDKGFVFGNNDTVFDLRSVSFIRSLHIPCIGDVTDLKNISVTTYKSILRGQVASGCNGVVINLTTNNESSSASMELNEYKNELMVLSKIYSIVNA